jgi:ABC-2 type transport system permease protein
VADLTPPGALGTALRAAVLDGAIAWVSLLVLAVWAIVGALLARRWFSFD